MCGSQERPDGPEDESSNAILVFLPGIKEITTLQELLQKHRQFGRALVLPIHSTVPPDEQRLVFDRAPPNVRKIVLATNIAETAITIQDVAFVVDTGRMKELRYDAQRKMSALEDVVVSRANARQRRGRAGRVREGVCVHLFTKHRYDDLMIQAQSPEVQRVPLEQLILRIKALKYEGTAAHVCSRLIEPPKPSSVEFSIRELKYLEALTEDEVLTSLGTHLSHLPVDCRVGKLILLGAMFGVADETLTIAAILSYRSIFLCPIADRDLANARKMGFSTGQSDHLTALKAYSIVDGMGPGKNEFARENFISIKTLGVIASTKRQLLEHLSEAGFCKYGLRSRFVEGVGRREDGSDGCKLALGGVGEAPRGDGRSWRGGGGGGGLAVVESGGGGGSAMRAGASAARLAAAAAGVPPPPPPPTSSLASMLEQQEGPPPQFDAPVGQPPMNMGYSSEKEPLVKAILVASLFPQLVVAEDSKKKKNAIAKLRGKPGEDGMDEEVQIHPQSVVVKEENLDSPYLMYHEKIKTTRIFLRDATVVSPHALALFAAGSLHVDQSISSGNRDDVVLRLDGWVGFSCPRPVYDLILQLRQELDEVLRFKIENPKEEFSSAALGLIDAVAMILKEGKESDVVYGGELARRGYGGGGMRGMSNNAPAMKYGGGGGGGGGAVVNGQPMSFWKDVFVCSACKVNSSGEIAFVQHCLGKKHASKAGMTGFAGLDPNGGGVTPTLSERSSAELTAKGQERVVTSGLRGGGGGRGGGGRKGGGGGAGYYGNFAGGGAGHQVSAVQGYGAGAFATQQTAGSYGNAYGGGGGYGAYTGGYHQQQQQGMNSAAPTFQPVGMNPNPPAAATNLQQAFQGTAAAQVQQRGYGGVAPAQQAYGQYGQQQQQQGQGQYGQTNNRWS